MRIDGVEFAAEFRRTVALRGRRRGWSPFQLVDAWRTFTNDVGQGYDDDIYAYLNELFLRDHLEVALTSESLNRFEAWSALRVQIAEIDEEFRKIISEGPLVRPDQAWWRARLPLRAGKEFVEEVRADVQGHVNLDQIGRSGRMGHR